MARRSIFSIWHRMDWRLLALLILTALHPAAASARALDPVGIYRLQSGPDVAGTLELRADGQFRYELIAGALDQWAQGRWTEKDGQIRLTSDVKPKPAELQVRAIKAPDDDGSLVLVTWPNGRGIAGIDIRLGLADGDIIDGFTQTDGWSPSADERRAPVWIELEEPIHKTASARIPLSAGQMVRAALIPNDMGAVDFDDALLDLSDDGATLHHPWGEIPLVRLPPRKQGE